MNIELLEFQERAIEGLFDACDAKPSNIVFSSCTGSGKTIMLTRFISDFLHINKHFVAVWLTPGRGNLEEQSMSKMNKYVHNAQTGTLSDVLTSGFAEGATYFINWETITRRGNVAIRDGEKKNLLERIDEAHGAGLKFIVIIDESHNNDTRKAQAILDALSAEKTIRASATPQRDDAATLVKVSEFDVIEQGLIKKSIIVNPDFKSEQELDDEVEFLLNSALEKRDELIHAFAEKNEQVNPLVLVQLESADDVLKNRVIQCLEEYEITFDNGNLAVWLADDNENTEGLEVNDARQSVLIFKQAIATGWDCPRAHILVKLRSNMDETFQIQTIGRIRRMPNAHHYCDEVLDNCYIFTYDSKFVEEARNATSGDVVCVANMELKPEFKKYPLNLKSEQRGTEDAKTDDRQRLKVIHDFYVAKYGLGDDYEENKTRLKEGGYVFLDTIVDTTKSGRIANVAGEDFNELADVNLQIHASNQILHDVHNHDAYHLAKKCGFGANGFSQFNGTMRKLFAKQCLDTRLAKNRRSTLLTLTNQERYRFIINNQDAIKQDVRDAFSNTSITATFEFETVGEKSFNLPQHEVLKYDSGAVNQDVAKKNVYAGYKMSATPRSAGETALEKHLEQSDNVQWWYKNGDKGVEYFSILYTDNVGNKKAFYPDYLIGVKDNGKVELIVAEVKGPFLTGTEDETGDIDDYSEKKFDNLARHCKASNTKGGFIRLDLNSQELMFCDITHTYTDDPTDGNWARLCEVF